MALVLLVLYPFVIGALAAHLCESRLSAKLGRTVTVGRGRGGLGRIVLQDVTIPGAAGGPPLATIERLSIPFGAALGMHSTVEVIGLRVHAVRGGDEDNVDAILANACGHGHTTPRPPRRTPPRRARGTPKSDDPGRPKAPARRLPDVILTGAAIEVRDEGSHLHLAIASLDGEIHPGARMAFRMHAVKGGLAFGSEGAGPRFGAEELDVETPLAGMRPPESRRCGWRGARPHRCRSWRSPGSRA